MKGLLVAFVAGIATALAIVAVVYLLSHPAPAGEKAGGATLVLAAHDLELGTIIREGDVVLTDWPGDAPVGASSHAQDFVGRGVITKIYAEEPILEGRLAPKGAGGGFATTIPQGMRAVAVPVNEVVGVAGFVIPGMHVDVLISGAPPGGSGGFGTQTKTLLQNIEVLSAGQDFKKDAEGKPVAVEVVNLLVTPDQAEQLAFASDQTTIHLGAAQSARPWGSKNSGRRPALPRRRAANSAALAMYAQTLTGLPEHGVLLSCAADAPVVTNNSGKNIVGVVLIETYEDGFVIPLNLLATTLLAIKPGHSRTHFSQLHRTHRDGRPIKTVSMNLDAVIFADGQFVGPDTLGSFHAVAKRFARLKASGNEPFAALPELWR